MTRKQWMKFWGTVDRVVASPWTTMFLAAMIIILVAWTARAQTQHKSIPEDITEDTACDADPRPVAVFDMFAERLAEKYGEELVQEEERTVNGVSGEFSLFANPETGTWTVLLVVPEYGFVCMTDFGAQDMTQGARQRSFVTPAGQLL